MGVEWKKDLQDAEAVITFHVYGKRNASVAPVFELDVCAKVSVRLQWLSIPSTNEDEKKK